jgi:hypothetical protein
MDQPWNAGIVDQLYLKLSGTKGDEKTEKTFDPHC